MYRLFLAALLLASGSVYAQHKAVLMPGQAFPYKGAFLLNNRPGQYQTIESYKGKYLLLDLFSSNCVQCFQNLPRLDSINKQYGKDLTILLVGKKDYKLEGLYEKYRKRFSLQLDVSIDSVLFTKVKYSFLPTYVWIGPEGLIRAVSAPDQVTAANIERFISGKPLSFGALPEVQNFDPQKDYLSEGNGGPDSNYLVRSLFGVWNQTLPFVSPEKLRFSPDSKKFTTLGKTMEGLYRYVYFNSSFWRYGDSLYGKAWLNPVFADGEVLSVEERYCFTASYKGKKIPDLKLLLKNTLEQYFGFSGSVIQQSMPYYSVRVIPALKEQLRTKGGESIRRRTHASLDYRNVSIDQLIERVSYYNTSKIPFVNESGIDFNVDVTIEAILTEEKDFFDALERIGIVIEKKYRLMDVLVLSTIK